MVERREKEQMVGLSITTNEKNENKNLKTTREEEKSYK